MQSKASPVFESDGQRDHTNYSMTSRRYHGSPAYEVLTRIKGRNYDHSHEKRFGHKTAIISNWTTESKRQSAPDYNDHVVLKKICFNGLQEHFCGHMHLIKITGVHPSTAAATPDPSRKQVPSDRIKHIGCAMPKSWYGGGRATFETTCNEGRGMICWEVLEYTTCVCGGKQPYLVRPIKLNFEITDFNLKHNAQRIPQLWRMCDKDTQTAHTETTNEKCLTCGRNETVVFTVGRGWVPSEKSNGDDNQSVHDHACLDCVCMFRIWGKFLRDGYGARGINFSDQFNLYCASQECWDDDMAHTFRDDFKKGIRHVMWHKDLTTEGIEPNPGPDYVSELQIFSQRRRLAPPNYTFHSINSATTYPAWTCVCHFDGKETSNTDYQKKPAKNESAKMMLELLN